MSSAKQVANISLEILNGRFFWVVPRLPEVGLEPTPCCQDGILNPARLPIPPLRHMLSANIKEDQRLVNKNTPATVTGPETHCARPINRWLKGNSWGCGDTNNTPPLGLGKAVNYPNLALIYP